MFLFENKGNKTITKDTYIAALAGNPNVGKSTVFNNLTGLKRHTGNWTGKTVDTAVGKVKSKEYDIALADIPGTYSLNAHSEEEKVASDFICFGKRDCVVVVCDACCLERNLILLLQIAQRTRKILLCVNLLDQAQKKGIYVDVNALSSLLGIECVGICAAKKDTLSKIPPLIHKVCNMKEDTGFENLIGYEKTLQDSFDTVLHSLKDENVNNSSWLCLKLLCDDTTTLNTAKKENVFDLDNFPKTKQVVQNEKNKLLEKGYTKEKINDIVAQSLYSKSREICNKAVTYVHTKHTDKDRMIDKIITGKFFAFPIMMLLLAGVFFLTISVANYPSQMLSDFLLGIEIRLSEFFAKIGVSSYITDMLFLGAFRVMANVVSVMLVPMAIFFPLFTLLEDIGLLPRIAFNLDRCFAKCKACGKQALTTCMAFGCNVVGVVGCRIIDSERERKIALLTNSFIPCNGRFPLLILLAGMFFASGSQNSSLVGAVVLSLFVAFSIGMSLVASLVLSKTVLKGTPGSFAIELPPYRKPNVVKVIVRSVLDRTLKVLGRAVVVALPAGLVIFLLSNTYIGDSSIVKYVCDFLDPFARLLGLDGVILCAFILGMPANEIVLPIALMMYLGTGTIGELGNSESVRQILLQNGWTIKTAICTMMFSLMHWPCSTTLATVYKETKSVKWTFLSFVLPMIFGLVCCFIVNTLFYIFA